MNIVSQFEKQVAQNPNAVAVVSEGVSWNYFQINNYANYIANILLENGVEELFIIGVSGLKSFEMIAAILAILKLKCSYMPLDLALPAERLHSILKNTGTRFIVSYNPGGETIDFGALFTYINLNYKNFDSTQQNTNLNKSISQDDPAYIMYTSGSTGIPKGIIVPHRGVLRLLVKTNYIDLNSSDSILFHSNTSFDAGIFEVWAALLNGARIVISPYLIGDIPAIFSLCQNEDITILLLTTGLFHIFSNMDLEKLSSLRYLVVGGDVMHSTAALRAIGKSKHFKIINGYGPAENTVFTTCLVIKRKADITHPISIGKPISGTKIYLLNEKYHEVKLGEVGELYTSGAGVALGYINAPALTAEKFIKIPCIADNLLLYRTGDLVKMLLSGKIMFVGRSDYQVKVRGFRVELNEIESIVSTLDYVEDVCACIIENQKIALYVKVVESRDLKFKKKTILSFLESKLPVYCIPFYIEINSIFPITPNGKIDRKQLQNRFRSDKGIIL